MSRSFRASETSKRTPAEDAADLARKAQSLASTLRAVEIGTAYTKTEVDKIVGQRTRRHRARIQQIARTRDALQAEVEALRKALESGRTNREKDKIRSLIAERDELIDEVRELRKQLAALD